MLKRVLPRSFEEFWRGVQRVWQINFYESLAFTADVGWGRGKGCLLAETLLKRVLPRSLRSFDVEFKELAGKRL